MGKATLPFEVKVMQRVIKAEATGKHKEKDSPFLRSHGLNYSILFNPLGFVQLGCKQSCTVLEGESLCPKYVGIASWAKRLLANCLLIRASPGTATHNLSDWPPCFPTTQTPSGCLVTLQSLLSAAYATYNEVYFPLCSFPVVYYSWMFYIRMYASLPAAGCFLGLEPSASRSVLWQVCHASCSMLLPLPL